jgi:hypothetical protein
MGCPAPSTGKSNIARAATALTAGQRQVGAAARPRPSGGALLDPASAPKPIDSFPHERERHEAAPA